MAINLTNLFTEIGKPIKYVNAYATKQAAVVTDRLAIEDTLEGASGGSQLDKADSLPALATGLIGGIAQFRTGLVQIIQKRMLDKTTVLDELGVPSYSLQLTLDALIRYMLANSASVDASTVSVGSVTANGANVGNGTVYATKTLDGYSSPGANFSPCVAYAGVSSEISLPETMTIECTSDSYSNGLTSGQESFKISGKPATQPADQPEGGSGDGPSLTAQSGNVAGGGDMETFSANLPTGWTGVSGTAGTHYAQDTINFYRGAGSLKLVGDGSQASIEIKRAITDMIPLRRYLVSFRYKASATQTGSQSFDVKFKGTGYTAPSGQRSVIAGGSLATSWTLVTFDVIVPASRPSDWNLSISNTGTPGSGKIIYVDDVIVQPLVWHNGIGFAAVPGATPFTRGDKFTTAITNDAAGTFQEFFRRFLRCQLPSNGAGSETINDSLAE